MDYLGAVSDLLPMEVAVSWSFTCPKNVGNYGFTISLPGGNHDYPLTVSGTGNEEFPYDSPTFTFTISSAGNDPPCQWDVTATMTPQ
jgi:hypothetical protein